MKIKRLCLDLIVAQFQVSFENCYVIKLANSQGFQKILGFDSRLQNLFLVLIDFSCEVHYRRGVVQYITCTYPGKSKSDLKIEFTLV